MVKDINYSNRERIFLWSICVFGFFVINISFIYGILFQFDTMIDALKNPISLAFMVETLLLLVVLAYLLTKWSVLKLHWGWFVFLSLFGSMAFALPVVLLWSRKR